MAVRVGAIRFDGRTDTLVPTSEINAKMTKKQAQEVIGYGGMGIYDFGKDVHGRNVLVKEGWEYYHIMRLFGYDLEYFQELIEMEEEGFSDDTFRCCECGQLDSYDNGYATNYRIIDDGMMGINCGCYTDYCYENWEEFIGETAKAMDPDAANKLIAEGTLREIDSYCAGMGCGMSDSPQAVYDRIAERMGMTMELPPILFSLGCVGQFDVGFSALVPDIYRVFLTSEKQDLVRSVVDESLESDGDDIDIARKVALKFIRDNNMTPDDDDDDVINYINLMFEKWEYE